MRELPFIVSVEFSLTPSAISAKIHGFPCALRRKFNNIEKNTVSKSQVPIFRIQSLLSMKLDSPIIS